MRCAWLAIVSMLVCTAALAKKSAVGGDGLGRNGRDVPSACGATVMTDTTLARAPICAEPAPAAA